MRATDLKRIQNLPYAKYPNKDFSFLRKKGGRMTLRPDQERCLLAAESVGGLFASLPVGSGKTLVTHLLPTILDKKVLILAPAPLVRQAARMREEHRTHFNFRDDFKVMSYSMLSQPEGYELLAREKPEVIIADECQALKSKTAARTRRFLRFMKENPEVKFCALSGTIMRTSVLDYYHLLCLALGGREAVPFPVMWYEARPWAAVLDPPNWKNRDVPRGEARVEILSLGEGDCPREVWQRRLATIPGVVLSTKHYDDVDLCIRPVYLPNPVETTINECVSKWCKPDGAPLMQHTELSLLRHTLRHGGYYRWTWPDYVGRGLIDQWYEARREFSSRLRQFINKDKPGLDTPGLVQAALEDGSLKWDEWSKWKRVDDITPAPDQEWVWLDESVCEYVQDNFGDVDLWFTDMVPVGQRLATKNRPFLRDGREVEGPSVLSVSSYGTGHNLQRFSSALVLAYLPEAASWEQLLGRMHRPGQERDVEYMVENTVDLRALEEGARALQKLTGIPQKLLQAEVLK